MIRHATLEDKEGVVTLLKSFFHDSEYSEMPWNQGSIEDIVEKLTTTDTACLLVADDLSGLIGGYATPYWMNMDRVFAQEMFWFVSKEKRGGPLGIRLLMEFEKWADTVGADYVVMSSTTSLNPKGVESVLDRKGYRPVDISYWKRLNKNGN